MSIQFHIKPVKKRIGFNQFEALASTLSLHLITAHVVLVK